MAIFKYTSLLRSSPPSEEAFNEIKAIAEIQYRFSERGKTISYANTLAGWMQSPVPREKILTSKYLIEEFKYDELANALQMLDPRRATVGVTCRELPSGVDAKFDKTEPIYGTEYCELRLSDAFMKEATGGTPIPELHLPERNLFIPEKLDVVKQTVDKPAVRPTLLQDTPISRLWHKQDDRFWLPKTNVDIMLHSYAAVLFGRTRVGMAKDRKLTRPVPCSTSPRVMPSSPSSSANSTRMPSPKMSTMPRSLNSASTSSTRANTSVWPLAVSAINSPFSQRPCCRNSRTTRWTRTDLPSSLTLYAVILLPQPSRLQRQSSC